MYEFVRAATNMVAGKVIVYGGRGALGSAVVEHFKKNDFWTLSIDMSANEVADANVVVDPKEDWVGQEASILNGIATAVDSSVDGIFCVAGGWAGGNADSDDFIKNADLMWKQSVWSSAIAAKIAAKHLKPGGVLQFTGALAATHGTAGMIGYGMAKAAVHQLTASLAEKGSGLPDDSCVLAILPITLDTPMNRKWMPKADHSTWTPMPWIAEKLHEWTINKAKRPESGSLLKLKTTGGETVMSKV
ncbi:oxidoreductase, short chain dehydrogenase/reductase family protein [Necator americanus]|uniref:Dihydropteridine reductase n=1 Tax=Necator americanus TaxID=51031 RepID=W2T488_NECAM|nr:oxidoreductase, short chain dehydrogenase/reductase family protein [Necator americanus]ETN76374.1 oxidoreductase, short chain dehydrogenase/reductase family protein [Necator americanus]